MVGADVIQTLVKRLPNAPGVYRMMNAAGDVLYVGKARSLKKRVTQYAQGRFHTNRIGRMVRETSTMEFVVTRTEIEALLLEANLIKRLRPRFNVLMRDDKSFPYILITGDHPSPASSSIAARARAKATISGRSPPRGRSAGPSIRCSGRSCSAPAQIRFSRTARGPACSTRSSAAPGPAPARSRRRAMPSWSPRRRIFSPAAARR